MPKNKFECPKDDFASEDWYAFFEHLDAEHKKDGYVILTELVLNGKIKVVVA